MNRPYNCPEHNCCPIFQAKDSNWDISTPKSGESFFCFGRMEKPTVFLYNGVEHKNNLSTCICTPLKGVIRFQENKNDWVWMKASYERALEKLKEIENES